MHATRSSIEQSVGVPLIITPHIVGLFRGILVTNKMTETLFDQDLTLGHFWDIFYQILFSFHQSQTTGSSIRGGWFKNMF